MLIGVMYNKCIITARHKSYLLHIFIPRPGVGLNVNWTGVPRASGRAADMHSNVPKSRKINYTDWSQ